MPKRYVNIKKIVRPNGYVLYRAVLTFKRDPITSVRPPAKYFSAKTEAEAHAQRERYKKQYNARAASANRTTFARFLTDEFLPHLEAKFRAGKIGWQHYQERRSRIERFVLKYDAAGRLRTLPLGNVTPSIVERLFLTLSTEPTCSARVYNDLRNDLEAAFKFGKASLPERWDDYLADVESMKEPKRIKQLFDADAVIEKMRDERLPLMPRLFVAFIFVMNCRPQDMFALRWTDLDLESGLVVFQFAAKRGEHGWTVREGTKTGLYDGLALPLGSLLTEMLKRAYAARKAAGKAFPWVFCRDDGTPNTNNTFRYEWPKIIAALGLPAGPSFYTLKTLGNSYWLAHGVQPAVQKRKMRHDPKSPLAETAYRTIFGSELENAVDLDRTEAIKGHQ